MIRDLMKFMAIFRTQLRAIFPPGSCMLLSHTVSRSHVDYTQFNCILFIMGGY